MDKRQTQTLYIVAIKVALDHWIYPIILSVLIFVNSIIMPCVHSPWQRKIRHSKGIFSCHVFFPEIPLKPKGRPHSALRQQGAGTAQSAMPCRTMGDQQVKTCPPKAKAVALP